jgi:hypothetical protein
MSEPAPRPSDNETARMLREQTSEPLLAAEKQLIAGSLILGIVLLGVLYTLTRWYF